MRNNETKLPKTKRFIKWTLTYYGILILLTVLGAFYFVLFKGDELKKEISYLQKRVPNEIDICFTEAVPSSLPSDAQLLETYYSIGERIEEIKVYKAGREFYAVFSGKVYKSIHPKVCEHFFQSAGVKRSP